MAAIARLAVIEITRTLAMLVVHAGLIVFMAKNTLKDFVV